MKKMKKEKMKKEKNKKKIKNWPEFWKDFLERNPSRRSELLLQLRSIGESLD